MESFSTYDRFLSQIFAEIWTINEFMAPIPSIHVLQKAEFKRFARSSMSVEEVVARLKYVAENPDEFRNLD